MTQKQTVVISDIHMGTNEATNWYQKDIHGPYLSHILNWILDHRTDVDELILLGDLFDFWTCAPDEKPPTAAQIVAANTEILGPNGLLSEVLSALDGRVSYVHGNHDITTTQSDLAQIGNPTGPKIKLQPDIYVKNGVVYTHGHLFTMFNAPDAIQPLPVGHFVTRAVSYYLKKHGEKAAEEAGFGVPDMGYSGLKSVLESLRFPGVLKNLKSIANFSITHEFLDIIQKTTGLPDDYPIQLERNLGTTTLAEVKSTYANLWSDWIKRYSDGEGLLRGFMFAYKAAWADANGSYLGWSAQQLAFQHRADLVVMGHTHVPKQGLVGDIANYINSGFECVPRPDMGRDRMTYSVVTTENGAPISSEVFALTQNGHGFTATNDRPPKADPGGSLASDYSCYVTVENKSDATLILEPRTIKNNWGYFSVIPPDKIAPKTSVKFWIQDSPGIAGGDGEVTYRDESSARKYHLNFACTTVNVPFNRNSCGGTDEFYSKAGSIHNKWGGRNKVAEKGHPLFVKFVVN